MLLEIISSVDTDTDVFEVCFKYLSAVGVISYFECIPEHAITDMAYLATAMADILGCNRSKRKDECIDSVLWDYTPPEELEMHTFI